MKTDFFSNEVSHTQKETVQLVFPAKLLADVVTAAEASGLTVGEYIAQAIKEAIKS